MPRQRIRPCGETCDGGQAVPGFLIYPGIFWDTHVARIVEDGMNKIHKRFSLLIRQVAVGQVHSCCVQRRPCRPEVAEHTSARASDAGQRLATDADLPSVLASGGRLSSSKLGSEPYVPQMVSPHRVSSSAVESPGYRDGNSLCHQCPQHVA